MLTRQSLRRAFAELAQEEPSRMVDHKGQFLTDYGFALLLLGMYGEAPAPYPVARLVYGDYYLRVREEQRRVKLATPRYVEAYDEYIYFRYVETGNLIVELMDGSTQGYGAKGVLALKVLSYHLTPEQAIGAIVELLDRFNSERDREAAEGIRLLPENPGVVSKSRKRRKAS